MSEYWTNKNSFGVMPGRPFVTVGNVGAGATYESSDQTAFNTAISAVASKGGEVYVLPGTLIKPTASLFITGTNVRVVFGRGSLVQLQTGVRFNTPIVSGGTASWTQIVVVAGTSGAPAKNIDIVDMSIDSVDHNTALISGLVVGGNVYNLTTYHCQETNLGRYGMWVLGYAEVPLGTAYAGPFYNITTWNHVSDNIGESNGSDGAHTKVSYTQTSGTVGGVHLWDDYATNLYAIAVDLPVNNGNSAVIARDFQVHGGHYEAQAANQPGIFLESQDGATGTGDAYDFVIEGCWVSGFTDNYAIDVTNHHVHITDCTSFGASSIGLTGSATLYASRASLAPQDWYIENFVSRQDPTAIRFVSTGLLANFVMEGISVRGGSSNDEGSTLNTVGISVTAASTKTIKDLEVRDFNLANIAGGGTPVSIAAGTAPYLTNCAFRSCPGFGGQGYALAAGSEPIVVAQTISKSETQAADSNVMTFTPPHVAGKYRLEWSCDVSSASSGVIGFQMSYVDSNGSTVTNKAFTIFVAGTAAGGLTLTTSVASNFTGGANIGVDASGTNVVIKWPGGGTTVAVVTAILVQTQ